MELACSRNRWLWFARLFKNPSRIKVWIQDCQATSWTSLFFFFFFDKSWIPVILKSLDFFRLLLVTRFLHRVDLAVNMYSRICEKVMNVVLYSQERLPGTTCRCTAWPGPQQMALTGAGQEIECIRRDNHEATSVLNSRLQAYSRL